ncbi:MAG TPA: TonB-dependent receptor [Terriglobales bacterium]|nr:TonB-dependent receptor [Terriglobales bacterium]
MVRVHWFRILPAVCLLSVGISLGQTPQGTVVGTVSDVSGARIAGARVSLAGGYSLTHAEFSSATGEFRVGPVAPGDYSVTAEAPGFAAYHGMIRVAVDGAPTLNVQLKPAAVVQQVTVAATAPPGALEPLETTSSVIKTVIGRQDLETLPLAHRSFANIAYLTPMTAPVEPSDPTKARITAVSFAGSSGLNVDLSVDGGDDNDDYVGGFLQNYSPDAMQEFVVRTAQFDADTSRTNGGSVILSTRRGTDAWHGDAAGYFRASALNARNNLDNPEPNPKQPYSRQNAIGDLGGPLRRGKLWLFSSLEYVHEDASVAYSALSLAEFSALSKLAGDGLIPGVPSIAVPPSVPVPFHDTLFLTRMDWQQSDRSTWFVRGALDRNHTENDLVQQGTLPSTGATTTSNYYSVLLSNQWLWNPSWVGTFTFQASGFHHTKDRNSHLGLALAFPFSSNSHTTSGFETFGDNQFSTPITAFPVERDQQKYQYRYDLAHSSARHGVKFGINFIHEPVLRGALASDQELLVIFPRDPTSYLPDPAQFTADFNDPGNQVAVAAGNGAFSQSVKRLGFYGQDSWRVSPHLTVNAGLRYDTTFGLFIASGRDQGQNPAVMAVRQNGIPLPTRIPHDYRGGAAPRLGIAYAPGDSRRTILRCGVGMYYNDLAQNGWVDAFTAVNQPSSGPLVPGEQGAVIDPHYHSPYALQASAGVERQMGNSWTASVVYQHQQGVHQYRRYEYVGGVTLFNRDGTPAPDIPVFRSDNRSSYDGASLSLRHRLSSRFDLAAHYTLARATTWGAVVGELFDYVNGVSDVRNPFGPGDHGPSGEDVRHRLVIAGTLHLPWKLEVSTLSQFESARPFTMSMPTDVNNDGRDDNDRVVVNRQQTSLDQFRGVPFAQVDLRVARMVRLRERMTLLPFVEFFNLFNRSNPGNNFVTDVAALNVPPQQVAAGNITDLCLDAVCSRLQPITSLKQLKLPAGALGDFFGPGTTVGIPFAAQFGVRVSF